MLSADLHHFLDLPDDAPGPARRLATQLGDLVRAATAAEPGPAWISALPCRRRPGHRACPGRMVVRRPDQWAPIVFECTDCSDGGVISGWQDSPYDGSDHSHLRTAAAGVRPISIPQGIADALRDLTFLDRSCQRVVYGARADRAGAVLTVTDDELEELLGSVAAQARHEPDPRRRRRLDAAFDTLETAARHVEQLRAVNAVPDITHDPAGGASARAGIAGLPDLDVARVQRWCAARVPERARHQVYIECQRAARHLTIVERRAPWSKDIGPEWTTLPIAELRYDHTTGTWTLLGRDRNMRFHAYDPLPSSPQIGVLLTEIEADSTGIFWG